MAEVCFIGFDMVGVNWRMDERGVVRTVKNGTYLAFWVG